MTVALTKEHARAADVLEALYIAASKAELESHRKMWDPDSHPGTRRLVFAEEYSVRLAQMHASEYDHKYEWATSTLMPVVAQESRAWAKQMLEHQAMAVGKVAIGVSQRAEEIHGAAMAARAALPVIARRVLTKEQYMSVTGQGKRKVPGDIAERLQRIHYMRAVVEGKNWYLHKLMVHPKGVKMVKAFAKSAEEGKAYALKIMADTEESMRAVVGDLKDDESLIWRYPPAIAAGVASMGFAKRPALTGFALAWAQWGTPHTFGNALDIAGNAILALMLIGGPIGVAVGGVLDFVLSAVRTAVSFVRDIEQDQAATATAFRPDGERLSEGSSHANTALMGAATIVSALMLPSAVSAVTRHVGRRATKLALAAPEPRARPIFVEDGALGARSLERHGLLQADARQSANVAERELIESERGISAAARSENAAAKRDLARRGVDERATGDPRVAPATGAASRNQELRAVEVEFAEGEEIVAAPMRARRRERAALKERQASAVLEEAEDVEQQIVASAGGSSGRPRQRAQTSRRTRESKVGGRGTGGDSRLTTSRGSVRPLTGSKTLTPEMEQIEAAGKSAAPPQIKGLFEVGPSYRSMKEALDSLPHGEAHVAQIVHKDADQRIVMSWWEVSERGRGHPHGVNHTEQKALTRLELKEGEALEIRGWYAPCPYKWGCHNVMEDTAIRTGADITYFSVVFGKMVPRHYLGFEGHIPK